MKKNYLIKALVIFLVSTFSAIAYAEKDKVIQIFKNGEVVQEFTASEIDYIEVNDYIPAPEGVKATVSQNAITITWNAVDGATYNIYRSADNVSFTLLATDIKETSYTDANPLDGSNYYRVTAVIDNEESKYTQSEASNFVENGLPSGIYLGIRGFSEGFQLYPLSRLSDENIASYHEFINGLKATEILTWLYLAVDKSIDDLQAARFPKDLKQVAIVTFTDGLDQGSLDEWDETEPGKYLTTTQYREALNNRLSTEKVSGTDISAYTIGIIPSNASSLTTFRHNMSSLATSSSNVYEVTDIGLLNKIFKDIANSLSKTEYVQKFALKISGQSHNEKCRFTFDNVSTYSASKLYIEGVYDRLTQSLTDIKYVGLSSSSGTSVKGVFDKIKRKYAFTFENLKANDGNLIPTDHVMHWFTDEGIWQDYDNEFTFNPDDDVEIEKIKSSVGIMLNLDCSYSMSENNKLDKLKEATNSFVQVLADNTIDPEEVSSVSLDAENLTIQTGSGQQLTATVLPATAKLKTVTWSSSDTSVAKVDNDGYVTAVAPGTASVTVTTKDGGFTATCLVKVVNVPVPQNISAKIDRGTVIVTWDEIDDVFYNVYHGTESGSLRLVTSSLQSNTYVDKSPYTGINRYCVKAVIDDKQGDCSEILKICYAPSPTNLTVRNVSDGVQLKWSGISNATFSVYRSTDGKEYTELASGIKSNAYTDTDVAPETVYYRVSSTIDGTASEPSEAVAIRYIAAPDIINCELSGSDINITWEPSGGCTYYLYRSNDNVTYSLIDSDLTSGTYTDTKPLAGVNFYRLKAVTKDSESALGAAKSLYFAFINGHAFVDLGLPSGLKWATMDVGATAVGGQGSYFAWGEISTKASYTQANSITTNNTSIRSIGGDSKYDAATAQWGASWRLPSVEEFEELINNCTWTWTTVAGKNGYIVKGPNGRTIFLPAAGNMVEYSKGGSGSGYYWSSSYYNNNLAWRLNFDSATIKVAENYKLGGLTVRPVSE